MSDERHDEELRSIAEALMAESPPAPEIAFPVVAPHNDASDGAAHDVADVSVGATVTDISTRGQRERRRWSSKVLAAAAAVVVLALIATQVNFGNSTEPTVTIAGSPDEPANDSDDTESVVAGVPGPMLGDHWHAVYGVFDCTLGDEGGYVPAFENQGGELGIHSHADGLIHIHPFFPESSGENAQMGHFFDAVGARVTSDSIELPSGERVDEGAMCADGSGPSEIRLLRWASADDALAGAAPDSVITEDLGSVRFTADREVFVIAAAAADAEIPLPPVDRFEALDVESPLEAVPVPNQTTNWSSVYGVYDCTLDGSGGYVAPFDSDRDDVGIHSHGDGLINIHPFGPESSGENAQMRHFFDAMGVTVTSDSIELDTGQRLVEGASCADGSGPAVIRLLRWTIAELALEGMPPEVVMTDEIGTARFLSDREVFVIAFAAADADIPLPPAERFDALNEATAPGDPSAIVGSVPVLSRTVTIQLPHRGLPGDEFPATRSVERTLSTPGGGPELLSGRLEELVRLWIAGPTEAELADGFTQPLTSFERGDACTADFELEVRGDLVVVTLCGVATSAGVGDDARTVVSLAATIEASTGLRSALLYEGGDRCYGNLSDEAPLACLATVEADNSRVGQDECVADPGPHAVIDVGPDDPDGGLVVHLAPGVETPETGLLPRGAVGVVATKCALPDNGAEWWSVRWGNIEGWVNARYLGVRTDLREALASQTQSAATLFQADDQCVELLATSVDAQGLDVIDLVSDAVRFVAEPMTLDVELNNLKVIDSIVTIDLVRGAADRTFVSFASCEVFSFFSAIEQSVRWNLGDIVTEVRFTENGQPIEL